jgi:tRNA A-37 threonylcarbamoyl transferase component Bud32
VTAPPVPCTTCATPLPADAQFCPRCGTRTPTQVSGGGTTTQARPVAPDALAEQRERLQRALGADYVVEELLGSGGFAQVWAAQDSKLHRRVAVKVLHPELVASRALIERFQREAQAVAQLRHPGIVPIYSVGEVEGLAFYVMPLIEGHSLREHLRGGALPAAEARRILREAATAIAVAHRSGIVHRDIKPENLMLDGEERRVLVMDFGIAKATQGAQAGLTGTGMIIGTPAYMSPEQATASKEIDARSDVYSLGVLGFEMLTGRTPFEATSVPDLVLKQITTPAPSLSALKPDAPEDLVIAVNRCLAMDPAQRWPHAGDLAAFLERQATPTGAPTPVSKELRKFAGRGWRPTRVHFRVAAVLAVLVALAVTWFKRPDLFYVAADFWHIRRLPVAPTEEVPTGAGAPELRRNWNGIVLNAGADLIAVVDPRNPFEGLHLFDGARWRSFRSPEPIRTAIPGDGAVLLFGDSTLYRWTADGIRAEGRLPFPGDVGWSRGRDLLIASTQGDLAWRADSGWQRQPSPRRKRLAALFGPARNRLFAIGYFASGSVADSVLEYTGVSWESVDPRRDTTRQWVYDAGAVLGDGTVLVGGRACQERSTCPPLLLTREASRGWQALDLHSPAGFTFDIWGIWGRTRDSLLVWNHGSCDRGCLAEITPSGIAPVRALEHGAVLGVAAIRGVPHALRVDGTLWARRAGQWAHAAEVPHLLARYSASITEGRYQAGAGVGDGLVRGSFSGDPALEDRTLLVPALPVSRFRGVAVGHHEAWLLGEDGKVYHADCRAASPCATDVVARLADSVVALAQQPGGGALAVGARGLVARSGMRGWQLLALPRGAERESLVAVAARADSGFVVLGRHRLFSYDRSGDGRILAELPPRLRAAALVAATPHGGAAAVTAAGTLAVTDSAGGLAIFDLWKSRQWQVTNMLPLDDGRLILAMTESLDDPYAVGRLWVVRPEVPPSPGGRLRQEVLGLGDEPRSGFYRLGVGGGLLSAQGMGYLSATWRLESLPLAPPAERRP